MNKYDPDQFFGPLTKVFAFFLVMTRHKQCEIAIFCFLTHTTFRKRRSKQIRQEITGDDIH